MEHDNNSDMNGKGICGLFNLGNTCYMNSVIQVLRIIPEWQDVCNKIDENEYKISDNKYKKLFASYIELTKGMLNAINGGCRPLAFRKMIIEDVRDGIYEQFATRMPCDAHEFMMYLMNNFHEAIKMRCPIPSKTATVAVKEWCKLLEKDYSSLNQLFSGLDKISCKCLRCGNISVRWETFNMLKFRLIDNESIENMILHERCPIKVEEYDCDNCKGKSTVEISYNLWRLSPIIFIVVHRFKDDGSKFMGALKCEGDEITFSKLFAVDCNEKSVSWKWEVIGTIDHHGSHMGGHYTAQVKHSVDGKWYLYDDETAHKIAKPLYGSHSYILCLRKI